MAEDQGERSGGQDGCVPHRQRIRGPLDRDKRVPAVAQGVAGTLNVWPRRHGHAVVGAKCGLSQLALGTGRDGATPWVVAKVGGRRVGSDPARMHLGHTRTIAGPHHRANVVEGPHAIQDHTDGGDGIDGGSGLLRHYPCRRIRSRISAWASRACCDRDVGGLAPGRETLLLPDVAGRAPNRAASASRVAGSSDTGGASGSSM